MTPEVLSLPEPVKSLLATVFETIDGTLASIVPAGQRWRLGGGTVLAARWGHRNSTDIDIFLPEDSGIVALDPRWNREFTDQMSALGATRAEVQTGSLKFSFPTGRVEITQLDPTPNVPPERGLVDGREIAVYGTAQILTGKLHGRGMRLPVRDIFDIAVARHEDPDALRTAVNFLDRNLSAEVIHTIRLEAQTYPERVAEAIIDPAPPWMHLLGQGPGEAVAAIEGSIYRSIEIHYGKSAASVSMEAADGWIGMESFASGNELAAGLTRLGLERLMFRDHRSVGDFIAAADAKLSDCI